MSIYKNCMILNGMCNDFCMVMQVYMYLFNIEDKKRIFIIEEGEFKVVVEWILEIDGIVLMKVFSQRDVDLIRIIINDIVEVFSVGGREMVFVFIEFKIENYVVILRLGWLFLKNSQIKNCNKCYYLVVD